MKLEGWVGRPYLGEHYCRIFAAQLLAANGIQYPEHAQRPEDAEGWQRVEHGEPCDVVVFNRAGRPAHVGVCIGRGRFIHVERGGRSRIESLTCLEWGGRIEGIYRCTGAPA